MDLPSGVQVGLRASPPIPSNCRARGATRTIVGVFPSSSCQAITASFFSSHAFQNRTGNAS